MSAFGFGIGLGLRHRRAGGFVPPPAVSAIAALVVQGITDLDPDGGGVGIDGNGWVAKAVMPFDGAATFDPNKILLTVSDPGFEPDGTATVRTRTIRGGAILRRQYPNQIEKLAGETGGNLEVWFSLEDLIFDGSTIVGVETEAGYYGDDAAGSVAGVVNSSALAYPPPLFAWLNVQQDRATGTHLAIEAVAYHREARLGQQVACIEFTATDASANSSAMQRALAPALSDFQTKGQRVEAWKAQVPLAALAQGDVCHMNAIVKPWIGEAWDLSVNEYAWPTANPQTRLRFLCDKTGGYGGAFACVKAGVTGGTVQTDIATARTTPFPTVIAARTAIGTWNGANKGHADLGGADIYLMDDGAGGPVDHAFAAGFGGTAGLTWINVRPDPANAGLARVAVGSGSTTLRSTPSLVRWYCDMAITGNAAFYSSATNGSLMCAHEGNIISFVGTGGGVSPHYQFGLTYVRNVTYSGLYSGDQSPFKASSTRRQQVALALGCVVADNTAALTIHPFAFIGCAIHRGTTDDLDPAGATTSDLMDGAVIANDRFLAIVAPCDFCKNQPYVRGLALVQNVIESASGSGQPALSIGAFGSDTMDNVIDQHNTVVGQRMLRAYADAASHVGVERRITGKYNIWNEYNCKSDSFDTNTTVTGRTGNWRSRYMVGQFGNVCMTGASGGGAPDPHGGSQLGEYWPEESYNVGLANVPFADDRSGAGGGDYQVTGADNAAHDRVPAGMRTLAFDLAGNARRDDGSGAAGAYEREAVG